MGTMIMGEKKFEVWCDMVEATSSHRPDESWRFKDPSGHEHSWYDGDVPAKSYSPRRKYSTPTLRWVKDGVGYYPDGTEYEIGHHECVQCGVHIEPRFTSDTCTQYVPGLRHCTIDGRPVTEDEFKREFVAAGGKL